MESTVRYYDYSVIDFESIVEKTNADVINYFDEYNTQLKFGQNFKKIFLHFFIKRICDICLKVPHGSKRILFCNPTLIKTSSEIFDVVEYKPYVGFVVNTLNELNKFLPVTVFFSSDVKFDEVSEQKDDNSLKFDFDSITVSSRRKSIKDLLQYANSCGLNLLGKEYGSQLQFRKIFI